MRFFFAVLTEAIQIFFSSVHLPSICASSRKRKIPTVQKDNRYYVLQTQVEKDVADEITTYFDQLNLTFIGTEATTRRYYPQNELAAAVIGFTNGDGDGQYGLEYQYDDYLAGVDGRVISAQAANGEEMPYRYSTTYEAEDGASLYLTLDSTLQYYLEKSMDEMVQKYEVKDRATGIIMNPKTGAIYAMATCPTFDLNNPSEIYDATKKEELAKPIWRRGKHSGKTRRSVKSIRRVLPLRL